MFKLKKKPKHSAEKMAVLRADRRTLPYVPDPEHIRSHMDRRGRNNFQFEGEPSDQEYINRMRLLSLRYMADFDVRITSKGETKNKTISAHAVDISTTGLLVQLSPGNAKGLGIGSRVVLKFKIPPGTMPEGFESQVKVEADVVRMFTEQEDGKEKVLMAFEFLKPLPEYFQKKRWIYSVSTASVLLLAAVLFVMLMRAESVIYFKYNLPLYLYSLIASIFLLSRYLFGSLYRDVPINPHYTPGVSIIIPCYNEQEWIHRAVISCMNQDYPVEKLEVIIVDDCSTDKSVEKIKQVMEMIHSEADRYGTRERLKLVTLPQNGGKRQALISGVKIAKHELVAFVDSDSFLEPDAIRHLVQPFQDPKMGGVSGRTEVENKYTNAMTKLQAVRYYIAFRIMKAAESYFDAVTCLSGPLSCYRKHLVLEHADAWLNQKFLGHPATFGDDRSMTNYILKTHRTAYQDKAITSTIVPSRMKVFLKQQMRWKRSWLRETLRGCSFIWRKEPFMALFFYIGFLVPLVAPLILLYNLVYVPLFHGVFPLTYLVGLFLMAMLMSLAHMLFRKSSLWIFGLVFCVFYEFVLLWQMPIAWFTFWKSTWGTRDTPQDIEERERKEAKRKEKQKKP